jgi:hypothetical protein
MQLTIKSKLTTEQRGRVLTNVLKNVGRYSPEISDLMHRFMAEEHPDYRLGQRNASRVVAYSLGFNTFDGDPDVAKAKRMAEGISVSGRVDIADVDWALTHLLFSQVVTNRLKKK